MELTRSEIAVIERMRKMVIKSFIKDSENPPTAEQLDRALLKAFNKEMLDMVEDGMDYFLDKEWQKKRKAADLADLDLAKAEAANKKIDELMDDLVLK